MIISLLLCAITDCLGKSPMRQRTFGPVGKKHDLYPDKKGKWHNFEKSGCRVSKLLLRQLSVNFSDQGYVDALITAIVIFTFTINPVCEALHPAVVIGCLYYFQRETEKKQYTPYPVTVSSI